MMIRTMRYGLSSHRSGGEVWHVCALARSGHHAVIFWLLQNLGVQVEGATWRGCAAPEAKVYYFNDCSRVEHDLPDNYRVQILSWEDVVAPELRCEGDREIIVLRDLVNTLASRRRLYGDRYGLDDRYLLRLEGLVETWKAHARRASTPSDELTTGVIYNRWLDDRTHRDAVCSELGIANEPDRTGFVPGYGEGSSFVGRSREPDPQAYRERGRAVPLPGADLSVLAADAELQELHRRLLGIDWVRAISEVPVA